MPKLQIRHINNFQTMCAIKLEFWMENFPKNWSYISTRSTLTPHGSVASSSVCSMTWLIVSRSERISARYFVPRTLRRVVAASKCVEWLKHSNNMIYCFSNLGSSRQKGKPWKYWQSRHAIRWKSTAFFFTIYVVACPSYKVIVDNIVYENQQKKKEV